jgi:predicted ATPase
VTEQPSGTVTLVFSDIEGSTKLLETLGTSAYREALAEHRRIVREAYARYAGYEVDYEGDAFFYTFASASDAVSAVSEAMKGLEPGPIRIRVGIHTGTPELDPPKYVGLDVHTAARIMSTGHGGQVVVSHTTAALVDIPLTELGEHRLKDITEAVPLCQLGEGSFPPLKTISNTNLPRPASSFVGRERETEEIVSLLSDHTRLLTLSGPGGSGKTRLAIEAASELVPEYKAGVFWVGLAALRDPALVTETIAQVLGAKDGLADHIGERELLLLIDNLEQVIDAAPELGSLLEACPNLKLLVTSRELLRIRGEVEYAVPPLAEPEAISLFCERSQLERDDAISELCRRLDNLPLAVELAAARTSVLTPTQILERLSQRLDLLKGGRDSEARQQTLRATIEWSYDLLSPEEQQLFARLSVFAGGCTLEAAEEVADSDLDTLQSLLDKSLVRFTDGRYWMLETIREYAADELEQTDEGAAMRERHLDWMLALAAEADRGLVSPEVSVWLGRIDDEITNLRVALELARESGRPSLQLTLITGTGNYWYTRGLWREARGWVEDGLAKSGHDRSPGRAKALASATVYALVLGDVEAAGVYGNEALSTFRELGDDENVGWLLNMLGARASELGDLDEAEQLFRESRVFASRADDRARLALATGNLGEIAFIRGRYDEAVPLLEEAIALARERGRGDLVSPMLQQLAMCELELGRLDAAQAATREALELARANGDVESLTTLWPLVATLGLRFGHIVGAAQLIGFGDAQCAEIGRTLTGSNAELRETAAARLRETLGEAAHAEALAEGESLSIDAAVALALDALSDP